MTKVILTAFGFDVHTDLETIKNHYKRKYPEDVKTIRLWLMDEYVNLTESDTKQLIADLQSWLKVFK